MKIIGLNSASQLRLLKGAREAKILSLRNYSESFHRGRQDGMTDTLINLERSILNGDFKLQIDCLNSLATLNVGMEDDRILLSLNNLKHSFIHRCFDCTTTINYVTCLHRFGDIETLKELLTYFSYDFAFFSTSDISRLARIYAIHLKDSPAFKELSTQVTNYIAVQKDNFKLDDLLACLLSCIDNPGAQQLTGSALQRYLKSVEVLAPNSPSTLQTILTALRLKRRISKGEGLATDIEQKSLNKVVECLEFPKHWENRAALETLTRICHLLSRRNTKDMQAELCKLARYIWEIGRRAICDIFPAKSSLYLLHSIRLIDNIGEDIRSWILSRIKPQAPLLTASELMLLIDCIDHDADQVFMQQFIYVMDELTSLQFTKLLKFYYRCENLPSTFIAQLRRKFSKLWEQMEPREFISSFNCLLNMKVKDGEMFSIATKYIYRHYISLETRDVALLLHTFATAKFHPHKHAIGLLYQVLNRDAKDITLDDLAKCLHFLAPYRKDNTELFKMLLQGVKRQLDSPVSPNEICNLISSLYSYRSRRINSILYSIAFESLNKMPVQQLCITLRCFANSGLINDNIYRKICHYISFYRSGLTEKDINNLLRVIQHGHATEELLTLVKRYGNISPVQRFIIEGGDIDVECLSDQEVLRCIYSLAHKPSSRVDKLVLKRLLLRLYKIGNTITPDEAERILNILIEYGHTKPKISRMLVNRLGYQKPGSSKKGNKEGNEPLGAVADKRECNMFRRIELGPPHLDYARK